MFVLLSNVIIRVDDIDYIGIQPRQKYNFETIEIEEPNSYVVILIRKGDASPITLFETNIYEQASMFAEDMTHKLNYATNS